MNKIMKMNFESSLTHLCSVNSSFDSGILRICYTGANRNGSAISRPAIEKSLPTIYNCPIVCNYDRETDTFGGHDIEVVRDSSGSLRIVNLTQPVGVIPESSKVWFEEHEDENGVIHEYLYAEVLLWKRQEAYTKIKEDGITEHSMEISVKAGRDINGIYNIDDFEFTAFALIGVTPCFEDSALMMFSAEDLEMQFSEMIRDLKETIKTVTASAEDDNTNTINSTEGGEKVLENVTNTNPVENIDVQDTPVAAFTDEQAENNNNIEQSTVNENENENNVGQDNFALTENILSEIYNVLDGITVEREWGTCHRYFYADCDFDEKMVYVWDVCDWLLYGFKYEMNGDSVVIDFDSKKRMKYVIAEFDEGEQSSPFASSFASLEDRIHNNTEWEAKYQDASAEIDSLNKEIDELRQFKSDTENAIAQNERDEVFAQFEDLTGVEAFETLRNDSANYDTAELEEKCYAIRGRQGASAKFSYENKQPKLKIETTETTAEPYGGIFVKYGIKSK